MAESEEADPSAGAARWAAPSVPEKHRQGRRESLSFVFAENQAGVVGAEAEGIRKDGLDF